MLECFPLVEVGGEFNVATCALLRTVSSGSFTNISESDMKKEDIE